MGKCLGQVGDGLSLAESHALKVWGIIDYSRIQVLLLKRGAINARLANTTGSSTQSLTVPATPGVGACFPQALLLLSQWNEAFIAHLCPI